MPFTTCLRLSYVWAKTKALFHPPSKVKRTDPPPTGAMPANSQPMPAFKGSGGSIGVSYSTAGSLRDSNSASEAKLKASAASAAKKQAAAAAEALARAEILITLFTTERFYSRDLGRLRRTYICSKRRASIVADHKVEPLQPEQEQCIFSQVEEISDLAFSLYNSLRADGAHEKIGAIFCEILPRMRQPYAIYHKNRGLSRLMLRLYKVQASAFFAHCKRTMAVHRRNWSIEAVLDWPLLRLCQYAALLDRLAQVTPRWDPDYKHLLTAARLAREMVWDYAVPAPTTTMTSAAQMVEPFVIFN